MANPKKISREENNQQKLFNSIAEKYDECYANPHALNYRFEIYDVFFNKFNLSGKKILDAMCGGGEGTVYFQGKGADVTGLDISEECCKIYKKRFPNGTVCCSSIINTEFPDSHFDYILTDSLHHLHPHLEKGMEELHRILKPQGYFCCWEPLANSLLNKLRMIWYKLDKNYFMDNEEAINIDLLTDSLKQKFEVVDTRYGGNLAYLFVTSSMFFRIPIWLVNIYSPAFMYLEKLLTTIQPRFLSLWVFCAMKKI